MKETMILDNVPGTLRVYDHFLLWRHEPKPTEADPHAMTKVPYQPLAANYALRRAASTRRRDWGTFDSALTSFRKRGDTVSGVGFVLHTSDPFTAIDLDHCIDLDTQQLADWARAIIDAFASYTEVSPSGTGIHIWIQAAMPGVGDVVQKGRKAGPIEAYSNARFLTLTGNHLDGTPATVEPRQEVLDEFLAHLSDDTPKSTPGAERPVTRPSVTLADRAVYDKACAAKNGVKFLDLWSGGLGDSPSASEADSALCGMLRFYTGEDAARIDHLFRQSGRYSEDRAAKWDRVGATTITNMLDALRGQQVYDPNVTDGVSAQRWRTAGSGTAGGSGEQGGETGETGETVEDAERQAMGYKETSAGLSRMKTVTSRDQVHEESVTLTNFIARIVADVTRDDGAETSHAYEMVAWICGGSQRGGRYAKRFTLPADRFSGMNWPDECLGASAIVFPNQREYARTAIKALSDLSPEGIPERRVYTHTGWRQIDGEWRYLHTGGALGASDTRTDVSVALEDAISRYTLPDSAAVECETPGALAQAVRVSIGMLEIAPDDVTIPLYAAIWRAAPGGADFTIFIAGATGQGKTQLAALAQQHYGAEMTEKHLASWSSTANILEAQAFSAKDTIFTIDEFVPRGNKQDIDRQHRDADRVLRGLGNGAGRGRMKADTTWRPAKPPRALFVSTGEDVPHGQSLRARMVILNHARGSLDWDRLTTCQRDAAAGTYALALAGYIQWIARRYDEVRAELQPQAARDAALTRLDAHVAEGIQERHARTSNTQAQLAAAMRLFARYAVDVKALTSQQAEELVARADAAIERVAAQQVEEQAQGDPVTQFLTLLAAAIASGEAHIADTHGEHPGVTHGVNQGDRGDTEKAWGWRLETRGAGENMTAEWKPQGRRIGWLDSDHLYLMPEAAYATARRLGETGDPLTVTPHTLWKRMHERRLLASTDLAKRQTLKVRRQCEGSQENVIDLLVDTLATYDTPRTTTSYKTDKTEHRTPDTADEVNESAQCRVLLSGSQAEIANPTSYPTSADAEFMGVRASNVGFVGFAADRRERNNASGGIGDDAMVWGHPVETRQTNPTPDMETRHHHDCEHPPQARHRLQTGVILCGLCGEHLQWAAPQTDRRTALGGGQ